MLRSFSFFLALLVALWGFASPVLACWDSGPKPAPFLERVGPALDLSRATTREIYFRFSGGVDELNELIHRGQARSTEASGKDPVYASFREAQAGASSTTTYIVGVSRQHGEVFEVSTMDGRRLERIVAKGGCGATLS